MSGEQVAGAPSERRALLRTISALFDRAHYLGQLDSSERPRRPLQHYLTTGWRRGLSPHPLFDPAWYWRDRPLPVDPLLHYATRSHRSNRTPTPLLDPGWYRRELAERGISARGPLLVHYLQRGWRERLSPHPWISLDKYLADYPDIEKAGVEPLTHFMTFGFADNRVLSGWLDISFVRESHGLIPDTRTCIRYAFAELVPNSLPTRRGQSPLLQILAGREDLPRMTAVQQVGWWNSSNTATPGTRPSGDIPAR